MTTSRWKDICEGCRYIHEQSPSQHCYMFKESPTSSCGQNTKRREKPVISQRVKETSNV